MPESFFHVRNRDNGMIWSVFVYILLNQTVKTRKTGQGQKIHTLPYFLHVNFSG